MSTSVRSVLAAAALTLVAIPLHAQDAAATFLNGLQIHGFATWSAGKSNGNEFDGATKDGNWRDQSFALNVAAPVGERIRVHAQVSWESTDGSPSKIDYAFAEWRHGQNFQFRAGQVQQPFGLYTEIRDVGTLRPFLELPQAVYGPTAFTGEAFKGLGISGTHALGAWTLDYDAYGGATETDDDAVTVGYFELGPDPTGQRVAAEANAIEVTNQVYGGRFAVHAPIDGLVVGTSAYAGKIADSPEHRRVYGAHAGYLGSRVAVRAEIVQETEASDEVSRGQYAEGALMLTSHWQIASSYGKFHQVLRNAIIADYHSMLEHEEGAAGLNFWVSENFVMKASYQYIDGNHFARPGAETLAAAMANQEMPRHTKVMKFGTQFSF